MSGFDTFELIQKLSKDRADEETWAHLYQATRPYVFTIAYRSLRGNHTAAEDITQDVFLRLMRYCDFAKFSNWTSFLGYLRATTLNSLRTSHRVQTHEVFSELDTEADPKPANQTQVELTRDLVVLARSLDKDDIHLLRLLLEGYSLTEIVADLQEPYSRVGVRIHRLRNKLKKAAEG